MRKKKVLTFNLRFLWIDRNLTRLTKPYLYSILRRYRSWTHSKKVHIWDKESLQNRKKSFTLLHYVEKNFCLNDIIGAGLWSRFLTVKCIGMSGFPSGLLYALNLFHHNTTFATSQLMEVLLSSKLWLPPGAVEAHPETVKACRPVITFMRIRIRIEVMPDPDRGSETPLCFTEFRKNDFRTKTTYPNADISIHLW